MLSHTGCGIIPASPTIINGSPASFPWMAFLFSSPENGKQSGFCGGSLISDLQILTAAHCVVGKTINDIAVILADKNPQEKLNRLDLLYLFKIEVYPSYNQHLKQGFKYNSDIASSPWRSLSCWPPKLIPSASHHWLNLTKLMRGRLRLLPDGAWRRLGRPPLTSSWVSTSR